MRLRAAIFFFTGKFFEIPSEFLYGRVVGEGDGWGYMGHSQTIPMVKMVQTLYIEHLNMINDELGVLYFISLHSYGQ